MAKYQKKPLVVDAVRWFKDGDHPAVESRAPMIVFDRARHYYYVYQFAPGCPMATAWLAVDEAGPVAEKHGAVLPFAFYEVKSGDKAPVAAHPDLLRRYMAFARWTTEPIAVGYLRARDSVLNGRIVCPGDWIVSSGDEHVALTPDVFAAEYEPAAQSEAAALREGLEAAKDFILDTVPATGEFVLETIDRALGGQPPTGGQ